MKQKLITLITSTFLILAAGSCSFFPSFIKEILRKSSYTNRETRLYAAYINVGFWSIFPLSFIYDIYGPNISLIISWIFLPGSYILINVILAIIKKKIRWILMVFLGFIMGQGSALCYITSISTNMKNLPRQSNWISSIWITSYSFSSVFFTSYHSVINEFGLGDNEFVIQVGWYISFILIASILLISQVSNKTQNIEIAEINKIKFAKYKEKVICNIFIGINGVGLFFIVSVNICNNISGSKIMINFLLPWMWFLNICLACLEYFGYLNKHIIKFYEQAEIRVENQMKDFQNKYKFLFNNQCNVENNSSRSKRELELINSSNSPSSSYNRKISFEVSNRKYEEKKSIIKAKFEGFEKEEITLDKQVNFSFDFDNRINDWKVKYELSHTENNFYATPDFRTKTFENKGEGVNYREDSITPKAEKREGFIESVNDNYCSNNVQNDFSINKISNAIKVDNNISSSNRSSNGSSNMNNRNTNLSTITTESNPKSIAKKYRTSNIQGPWPSKLQNDITAKNKSSAASANPSLQQDKKTPKTFFQIFRSDNCIKLMFILMIITGSAMSNIDNITLILTSLNLNTDIKAIEELKTIFYNFEAFVSLFSAVIINFVSSHSLWREYLILISLLGLTSQIIASSLTYTGIYLSLIWTGIVKGWITSFIPMYVNIKYKKINYGKMMGLLITSSGLGVLFISNLIFRIFYYVYRNDSGICEGKKCFLPSFCGNVWLFAWSICILVFWRFKIKKVYKRRMISGNVIYA